MQWILEHRAGLWAALVAAIAVQLVSWFLKVFCVLRMKHWFRAAFPEVAGEQRPLTPEEEEQWEWIHREKSDADRVFTNVQLAVVLLQLPSVVFFGGMLKRDSFKANPFLNVLVWFGLWFLLLFWL